MKWPVSVFPDVMLNTTDDEHFELSHVSTHGVVLADRGVAHSEESRLANLLRRVSREDDRDRRLATLKQLKEFISYGESKAVSQFFC